MVQHKELSTDRQKRAFWAHIRQMCGQGMSPHELKESIVSQYTHGRTISLRAMRKEELGHFLDERMRSHKRKEIIAEKMRWKTAYMLQSKGYIAAELRGKELFECASQIVHKRFAKDLRTASHDALRLVLSVVQTRWKEVAQHA